MVKGKVSIKRHKLLCKTHPLLHILFFQIHNLCLCKSQTVLVCVGNANIGKSATLCSLIGTASYSFYARDPSSTDFTQSEDNVCYIQRQNFTSSPISPAIFFVLENSLISLKDSAK